LSDQPLEDRIAAQVGVSGQHEPRSLKGSDPFSSHRRGGHPRADEIGEDVAAAC
jgi:hypothetical protein